MTPTLSRPSSYTAADLGRIALRWALYAVPSVVVPIILGLVIKDSDGGPLLSNYDQMVIGALLFIIMTLASIGHDISALARLAARESRTARIENEVDSHLVNFRTSFNMLLQRAPYQENLFALLFTDALKDMEKAIFRAASDQSLPVDKYTYKASAFTTAMIGERNRDVLRFVHHVGDTFVTTLQGQDFNRRISAMCCKGNVTVRRLCVYRDSADLLDSLISRIFEFHSRNRNHDYRVLSFDAWSTILQDFGIHEFGDMGVWGDILCYRSPEDNAANTQGLYSTDPAVIVRFSRAFDRAWDHGDVPLHSTGGPMTVYELAHGSEPPPALRDRERLVVDPSM
ncbi:hypothetical protein ACPCI0_22575 [Streptomyces griseoincarnatus]